MLLQGEREASIFVRPHNKKSRKAEAYNRRWGQSMDFATLQRDHGHAWKAAGNGDVVTTIPHITIKHITNRLKPHHLQNQMPDIIHWRKNCNFDMKIFNQFMPEAAKEEEKLEEEQSVIPMRESHPTSNNNGWRGRYKFKEKVKPKIRSSPTPESSARAPVRSTEGAERKRDACDHAFCLYPDCKKNGIRH